MRFCFLLAFLVSVSGYAQLRIEPQNWWTGMKDPKLQLLVHGQNIGSTTPAIKYPGVRILKVHKTDSPNYLFIDLEITKAAVPGSFLIQFGRSGKIVEEYEYALHSRTRDARNQAGFNSSDVIYLVTPDRFANGDAKNDVVAGMREQKQDRGNPEGRHGGDLRGIINNLDYIEKMGFTAIWPTPVLENDMARTSYHGYAITDHYKVDPRMGTMADYLELASRCRAKGIKLVFDGVANHTGISYWWKDDLPFKDWINYPDTKTNTNHRRTVHQDPYAASADRELMYRGWFVSSMPDLNQDNSFVANYIIQNNIWWIEKLALAGIRQDTYPYSSKKFLQEWTCRIVNEYPQFSIVGEEWSYNPLLVAYWQKGKTNNSGYNGCMTSSMDFPMQQILTQSLAEAEGWNSGLVRLYEGLANDFVYASPKDLLIFGDNHDMDRLFTQVKQDPALHKMALAWLLTSRGIPQIYYGTEVLIDNTGKPGDHGIIRSDMPGGWPGDAKNAFTGEGLSESQRDVQSFLKQLLNWRKKKNVIHKGSTRHFAPENGVYVYFRYDAKDLVMVVMNKNDREVSIDTKRFAEMLGGKKEVKDVVNGKSTSLAELKVPGKTAGIYEVK